MQYPFRACIRSLASTVVGLVLLGPWGTLTAIAQSPGATLSKCTCHLDENAPPDSQGARAANATLCVQMLDKGHRWCEITVACLRGNIGPQCQASSGPKEALLQLYDYSAKEILTADGPQLATFGPMLDRDKNFIAEFTKIDGSTIDDCVRSYLTHSKEDTRRSGKGVRCGFDRQSGWLAIVFDAGAQLVQFSFGPRE
jgi:hypothetical protein